MPGKCKFQDAWLSDPQYNKWIERGSSSSEAKCKACKKTFAVQNMGEAAVKSHMKSKKHVDAVKDESSNASLRNFLPAVGSQRGSHEVGRSEQPCSSGAGDIRNYVASNETLAAEVLWALKVILSHYSYKSCEDIP